jgi:hypothetical protein
MTFVLLARYEGVRPALSSCTFHIMGEMGPPQEPDAILKTGKNGVKGIILSNFQKLQTCVA